MISVESLVKGLQAMPVGGFGLDSIYDFLSANPVDPESVEPFAFWSSKFYTRNLIHKEERFEVMLLCWEQGQVSRVHDHADQNCWMTVLSGRLRGQNFAPTEFDGAARRCRLVETTSFDLADCLTAKVELEEPIHQILNLPEFGQRAVSLHVYSKPIERCNSFCLETDTFKEVELFYTSVGGKLCDGISL